MLRFLSFSQSPEDTLKIIEQKYGEQWDFCTCVVKNDSIEKALIAPNLTDEEFNKISERFDEIDQRCTAFRILNNLNTPEDRLIHAQKVKSCLKNED